MAWKKLYHDQCILPTRDKVNEVRAKPGSVWQCGASGCNELWRYEGDDKWTPLEAYEDYRPKQDPTQIRSEDHGNVWMATQEVFPRATAGAGSPFLGVLEPRAARTSGVLAPEGTTAENPTAAVEPQPPSQRKRNRLKLKDVTCACSFVAYLRDKFN